LAAVGERMTEGAGRGADGPLCPSFTTEAYLRRRPPPALRPGRPSLGRVALCLPAFVVLRATAAERAAAAVGGAAPGAFYGSTPSYRPVLDLHGWGDLHDRLHSMSRRAAWREMGDANDDNVLDAFAVSGDAFAVAAGLRDRFGDMIDRISLYTPYEVDEALVREGAAHLRAMSSPASPSSSPHR